MKRNISYRIFSFYYQGFRNLPSWGKAVWIVILVKLFVMFFVLKLFFFQNYLNTNFENEEEKGNYVLEQLTQ